MENKKLVKIIEIITVLFGLFILFQIIRKVLGGSWGTENIILGLVVLNTGCIFTIAFILARLISDHNHLKDQFRCMARDFKALTKDFRKMTIDFINVEKKLDTLSYNINIISRDIKTFIKK